MAEAGMHDRSKPEALGLPDAVQHPVTAQTLQNPGFRQGDLLTLVASRWEGAVLVRKATRTFAMHGCICLLT